MQWIYIESIWLNILRILLFIKQILLFIINEETCRACKYFHKNEYNKVIYSYINVVLVFFNFFFIIFLIWRILL